MSKIIKKYMNFSETKITSLKQRMINSSEICNFAITGQSREPAVPVPNQEVSQATGGSTANWNSKVANSRAKFRNENPSNGKIAKLAQPKESSVESNSDSGLVIRQYTVDDSDLTRPYTQIDYNKEHRLFTHR